MKTRSDSRRTPRRRCLASALTLAMVLQSAGCMSTKMARLEPTAAPPPSEKDRIVGLTTRAGEDVSFDSPAEIRCGRTVRAVVDAEPYEISLDAVQTLWFEQRRANVARTLLFGGVAGGIFLLMSHFDPFSGEGDPCGTALAPPG